MNIQGTEQIVAMQLLGEYMKRTMGDSPAFDIVMESVMQSIEKNAKDNILSSLVGQVNDENSAEKTLDLKELTNLLSNRRVQNVSTKVSDLSNLSKDERINNAIDLASKKYGVDKNLIRAIIKQESNFNPNAVSSAGAMGLMQLMPENLKEDGVTDPFNIEQNIDGGTKQLKGYLQRYNNNVEMALMAYNAGPGTVQKRGVKSVADLYKMPAETRNYVVKIMNNLSKL
jgi:soluble lytic murein transglycosylase-like protein